MKKLTLLSFLIFMVASSLSYSQAKNNSTGSIPSGNSIPGLTNITEFNIGIGLYARDPDYSKRFLGLTSVCSVGLTRNLTGGIGVGVSFYNGGILVPLFADFRYFFNLGKTKYFAFGDGGILLNSAKTLGGTKIIVNPGAGVVFPVSNKMSVNLGAGLFVQLMKDHSHDSFANIKLGITYSFRK